MLEQELKEIWKNSSEKERVKFDLSRLLIELTQKMNKIERGIRRRNRTDLATMAIGIPIFGYLAYIIPFPLTKIGIVLAMVGFVWGILKYRHHIKSKQPILPTLSFSEQLAHQKANMLREVKLLDTVLYWFVIPGFIPYAISILGLGDPAAYGWSNNIINQLLPMPMVYKIAHLILAIIVFASILWTNKRVVKKTLKPMIQDIEKAQLELENEY